MEPWLKTERLEDSAMMMMIWSYPGWSSCQTKLDFGSPIQVEFLPNILNLNLLEGRMYDIFYIIDVKDYLLLVSN